MRGLVGGTSEEESLCCEAATAVAAVADVRERERRRSTEIEGNGQHDAWS